MADKILGGKFAPGAPLREEDLAAKHEVSRNTMREVLRLLAADGLAEYSSYRGARVPLLTVQDVEEVYKARRFLELSAVQTTGADFDVPRLSEIHAKFADAVASRDDRRAFMLDLDFHSSLVALGGSDRVAAWHRDLLHSLRLAHLVGPSFSKAVLRESVGQHAEIIVALAGKDAARAAAALQHHLEYAERSLIAEMTEPENKHNQR